MVNKKTLTAFQQATITYPPEVSGGFFFRRIILPTEPFLREHNPQQEHLISTPAHDKLSSLASAINIMAGFELVEQFIHKPGNFIDITHRIQGS